MAEEKKPQNLECTEEKHKDHLCFLMAEGWHLANPQQYKAIVTDAQYRCRFCDRTANNPDNLCQPIKL